MKCDMQDIAEAINYAPQQEVNKGSYMYCRAGPSDPMCTLHQQADCSAISTCTCQEHCKSGLHVHCQKHMYICNVCRRERHCSCHGVASSSGPTTKQLLCGTVCTIAFCYAIILSHACMYLYFCTCAQK